MHTQYPLLKYFLYLPFVAALFFSVAVTAQDEIPRDDKTDLYTYDKVVKVDSLSKKQLYENAKIWAAKRLRLLGGGLQLDERENNAISGTGFITIATARGEGGGYAAPYYDNINVTFAITLQFKQGKYRYTITNFCVSADKFTNEGYGGRPGEVYAGHCISGLENSNINDTALQKILEGTQRKMKALIFSLVETMQKPNKVEDW